MRAMRYDIYEVLWLAPDWVAAEDGRVLTWLDTGQVRVIPRLQELDGGWW